MNNWNKISKLIPFPPSADDQQDMGMFPYAVNPSFVQRYRNPVVAQQQTSDDDMWYHLINDCGVGLRHLEGIDIDERGIAHKIHGLIPHICLNNAK